MRTTHYALVCALFTACAWGGDTGKDDDDQDPPPSDPPPAAVCGDGTCAATEVGACASDCGSTNPNNPVCGNGSCEAGESPATCAGDCQASGPVCGNATCETGETSANCPGDCGGGGGGGLDCGDFAVLLACASCIDDPSTCSALGVDEAGCNACLMGPMP